MKLAKIFFFLGGGGDVDPCNKYQNTQAQPIMIYLVFIGMNTVEVVTDKKVKLFLKC